MDEVYDTYHADCLDHGRALFAQLRTATPGIRLYAVEFNDYDDETNPIGWVMRNAPDAFGAALRIERRIG
jgi:hypothetical protein